MNRTIEPALVYADPHTFSGPDEKPEFDEDDELVFMARHLGKRWIDSSLPENVLNNSFVEIEVTEAEDILGYIYLFKSEKDDNGTAKLSPDAGHNLVEYELNFLPRDGSESFSYKDDYKFDCEERLWNPPAYNWTNHDCLDPIMNPEDSWFKSPFYERHFQENWYSDQVKIKAGTANGQNFWGVEEFQLLQYLCDRNVYTFTHGPTAFIASKIGPIRAIRSIVGGNSGVLTVRNTLMYEQMEETTTFLRVHPIPGMFYYLNFKKDTPLTFYNCQNKQGFEVSGHMDENEKSFDKF